MTTLQIDLAELLEQKYPHGFHVPADIVSTFLEFADDDWTHALDIDDLLADRQLIGVVWNTQLILDERPDLTEDQAWNVLQACQNEFEEITDPMLETIRRVAADLFPKPTDKAAIRARLSRIERWIDGLPDDACGNPAAYGSVAVALDALEPLIVGGQP